MAVAGTLADVLISLARSAQERVLPLSPKDATAGDTFAIMAVRQLPFRLSLSSRVSLLHGGNGVEVAGLSRPTRTS